MKARGAAPWRRCSALLALLLAASCSRTGAPAAAKAGVGASGQAPGIPAASGPALPALAPGGEDFSADARLLFRVAACGGDDPLPPAIDAAIVEEHCRWLRPVLRAYREKYLARLEPFFAAHRPAGLPPAVVYPFGGGDLLSALATYPDALEYTTLSLEHAGDPRRIRDLDQPRLAHSLAQLRQRIKGLFAYAESTSENLMQMQRGDIPGQLAFFLVALSAHGYEPAGLRYFHLQPDGSLRYLGKEEIAAEERMLAQRLNKVWVSPDFATAFSDSELTFRRRGEGAEAPLRVHRHIAANLSDDHLAQDPGLLKHLEAKGKVAAMTKAASYLLWAAGFADMRSYLLSHMVFMVSDSTGIPPRYATKAGFAVETYGRFKGPFLLAAKATAEEFVKLWSDEPHRPLPFRYGYPDASGQNHLMIWRRAVSPPAVQAAPSPPARPAP